MFGYFSILPSLSPVTLFGDMGFNAQAKAASYGSYWHSSQVALHEWMQSGGSWFHLKASGMSLGGKDFKNWQVASVFSPGSMHVLMHSGGSWSTAFHWHSREQFLFAAGAPSHSKKCSLWQKVNANLSHAIPCLFQGSISSAMFLKTRPVDIAFAARKVMVHSFPIKTIAPLVWREALGNGHGGMVHVYSLCFILELFCSDDRFVYFYL